ncbi:GIY-YIG nuclease family protein [uncultured Fusobacterium sp.]|uniref:GIY-YIG nuclease family protein n=1 Tax=uncultured Fusobacterium sp. TaxID=159267 RepID=UPI0025EEA875|nr:GIY-YIG nuclease family protein [uncultured Fusobacterium sp.]
MEYYVYIIRCRDNSLYTGITTDIGRRYKEHEQGTGAKYTKSKGVLKIETFFKCDGRSEASKIEYYIKKMTKDQKECELNKINGFKTLILRDLGIIIK